CFPLSYVGESLAIHGASIMHFCGDIRGELQPGAMTTICRGLGMRAEEETMWLSGLRMGRNGHGDDSTRSDISSDCPRLAFRYSHGGTGEGSIHKPFFASRASFSSFSSSASP